MVTDSWKTYLSLNIFKYLIRQRSYLKQNLIHHSFVAGEADR